MVLQHITKYEQNTPSKIYVEHPLCAPDTLTGEFRWLSLEEGGRAGCVTWVGKSPGANGQASQFPRPPALVCLLVSSHH